MKLCSSDKDIQCVENARLQYNKCLRPCEGLYVDVKKSPVEVVQVAQYKLLMKDYANHTWFHENNILEMEDMQGNLSLETFKHKADWIFLELQHESHLKFVRIYFDTPTFDRITKDKSVNFVDMLSSVGGTMGLLTGFSLISAV